MWLYENIFSTSLCTSALTAFTAGNAFSNLLLLSLPQTHIWRFRGILICKRPLPHQLFIQVGGQDGGGIDAYWTEQLRRHLVYVYIYVYIYIHIYIYGYCRSVLTCKCAVGSSHEAWAISWAVSWAVSSGGRTQTGGDSLNTADITCSRITRSHVSWSRDQEPIRRHKQTPWQWLILSCHTRGRMWGGLWHRCCHCFTNPVFSFPFVSTQAVLELVF